MGGICVVGMQPTCPAPGMNCVDQPTGKMYCARVDSDPGNCGRCGNVCPAGTYCQNYGCVPMAGRDGGTTGCADPMTRMGPDGTGSFTHPEEDNRTRAAW